MCWTASIVIEICTSYRGFGSRTITELPSDSAQLAACEPMYESWPGVADADAVAYGGSRALPERTHAATSPGSKRCLACRRRVISTGSERDDTIGQG